MTDLFTRPCKVCGKTLTPRQRACCSRRCALRAGFTPRSMAAREQLAKLISRVPRHIHDGSLDGLHRYMDIHKAAAQAFKRRAGWRVCEVWVEELRKAAS